jgi:hypothetical protein
MCTAIYTRCNHSSSQISDSIFGIVVEVLAVIIFDKFGIATMDVLRFPVKPVAADF